jgi:Glycosyl transferases group 1
VSRAAATTDRPLRIYALFGDGGQYAGQVARGPGHEIHFSAFGFDELIRRERGDSIGVRTQVLEQVLAEMEAFDAVFSDSPEVVLLRYVRQRRGLRAMPWLVNEVDHFAVAGQVRRFVQDHYGEDPLPEVLRAPEVQWFTILEGQHQRYGRLGLRTQNLHFLPMCKASIAFFFPETIALQDRLLAGDHDLELDLRSPVAPGAILALGSHERDYACLAEALRPTGLTADVICNLALYPDRPDGSLRWHDSQSPAVYLESIRRAAIVVLPLRPSGRAAGQLSAALPMRMAKPLVATQMDSLAPLLSHGVTGLTYRAGDAVALRDGLQRLLADPGECARLGAAAAAREQDLCVVVAQTLERILLRLAGAGSKSTHLDPYSPPL